MNIACHSMWPAPLTRRKA